MKPNVASIAEFAEEFNESPRLWWNRCRAGHVPGAFQVGRLWYVDKDTFWNVKLGREVTYAGKE